MAFLDDLKTSRAAQIRFGVAAVIGILWFTFAISQFVRVDHARHNPYFVLPMPPMHTDNTPLPASVIFPSFSICAMVGDKPPAVTCKFTRSGENERTLSQQTRAHVFFDPLANSDIQKTCIDVTAAAQVGPTSSYTDVVRCYVTSLVDLNIFFFSSLSANLETSKNNFDWHFMPALRDASFGLTAVYVRDSSQTAVASNWQVRHDLLGANPGQSRGFGDMAVQNKTTFTVQVSTDIPVEYQVSYRYDFWQMLGVLGGATLVFYGLYALFVALLFRALKVESSSSGVTVYHDDVKYQTMPDDPPSQPASF